jgi:hypothetical protein
MTGTVVLRTTDQYIKAELEAIHPVYKVKAFKGSSVHCTL